MKTRVNFFREDLKPKIVLINLNFVLFIAGLSLVLLTAGWFWAQNQYQQAEQQVAQMVDSVEQKKFLVNTLVEAKNSRTQDLAILAEIESTQQELSVKQTILEELSRRETQRSHGFSDLMLDLASNHQPSLWLTYINLDERKLYIEGRTSDSEAMPKWLNKLSQAEYFSGKEFAGARIFRDENKALNFVLSSELDDVKGAGK